MSDIENGAGETAQDTTQDSGDAPQAPVESAETETDASAAEIERVRRMFARTEADGAERFLFARWTKPIALAVIGLEAASAERLKAGFATAAAEAGATISDVDPELGANLLAVFCADWSELKAAPGLGKLVPDLDRRIAALEATGAESHRLFNLSPETGLRMAISLTRYDADEQELPVEALTLGLATRMLAAWSEDGFENENPISIRRGGRAAIRRWCGGLLKAAYAEETPGYSTDPALAEALTGTMRRMAAQEAKERADAKARDQAARDEKAREIQAQTEHTEQAEQASAETAPPSEPAGEDQGAAARVDSMFESEALPEDGASDEAATDRPQ